WVRLRRRAADEKLRSAATARKAARSGSCISTPNLNEKNINFTCGPPAAKKVTGVTSNVRHQTDHLRHDPARRRAGPGLFASHRREAEARAGADVAGAGHHRRQVSHPRTTR